MCSFLRPVYCGLDQGNVAKSNNTFSLSQRQGLSTGLTLDQNIHDTLLVLDVGVDVVPETHLVVDVGVDVVPETLLVVDVGVDVVPEKLLVVDVGVDVVPENGCGSRNPPCGSPWQVPVMTGAKMAILGEAVRLVASGANATFELSAVGFSRDDIEVNIISPSKRPVTARLLEDKPGEFRVEFTPTEVGSHLVEVSVAGQKLPAGPLVAKVYNSALIRVTDVASGVVGQPCQFRVDASQAGEGQLEISINEGEVPNHVQVVGGGRCLVSFTPEHTKPHLIDIKFNGETTCSDPVILDKGSLLACSDPVILGKGSLLDL
uniref:Filamin n=1 Tax=Timema tahoe TaxID=61484 RepID=A0A7R9ITV2_9NEOP|nr:unnamed protein product [Timema tahoe]